MSTVTIDLSVNLASGGEAQGDGPSGIENLLGGDADDKLSGHGADNPLVGNGGTDTLRGKGGADAFLFSLSDTGRVREADRIEDFSQAEGDQILLFSAHGAGWDYTFIWSRCVQRPDR